MTVEYIDRETALVPREKKTVVVERELQRIYKRAGSLTPALLVESAKSPRSKLHDYFDWNDETAGHKYRLAQATHMLLASKFMCVLKEQADAPPQVEAAVPVRQFIPQLGRGSGFRSRGEVLGDDDGRRAFVERRLGVLRSWCTSVVDVDELSPVRATILDAIEAM